MAHHDLTLTLVPELLGTHPYFDTPEPDMDDPACILATLFQIVYCHFLKISLKMLCILSLICTCRYRSDDSNIKFCSWVSHNGVFISRLYYSALLLFERQLTYPCTPCEGNDACVTCRNSSYNVVEILHCKSLGESWTNNAKHHLVL